LMFIPKLQQAVFWKQLEIFSIFGKLKYFHFRNNGKLWRNPLKISFQFGMLWPALHQTWSGLWLCHSGCQTRTMIACVWILSVARGEYNHLPTPLHHPGRDTTWSSSLANQPCPGQAAPTSEVSKLVASSWAR
jgi:hypothetical protein